MDGGLENEWGWVAGSIRNKANSAFNQVDVEVEDEQGNIYVIHFQFQAIKYFGSF